MTKYLQNYFLRTLQRKTFRILVMGPPTNYVYGFHVAPFSRGALGYVSYQEA